MAQATAQGFKRSELEPWAFVSLDDGPTRPGFGTAGPGWLTALGQAQHITSGEDQYKKGNTSVVGLSMWSRTLHLLEGTKKVVVGVPIRLSLMSGEADFDEAKGEVEARLQIYLGGQGQGQGHC